MIGTTDFYLQISKSQIIKHSSLSVIGRNQDIDVGTEDLWGQGGTFVPPTAARIHDIVSSSANDTSAGTGARTVTVSGLDGSYLLTSENINMNGAAPVATVNSYVFVNSIEVLSQGSGGTNAGIITATAQTDTTVSCSVPVGENTSTLGAYQIPTGYYGYLVSYSVGFQNVTGGASADVKIYVKDFGAGYSLRSIKSLINTGTSSVFEDLKHSPIILRPKSIVKMTGISATANSDVHGVMNIILVQN